MDIKDFFTYLFGFLTLLSGIGVIVSKKSLNSALSLVSTMVLIAAQFAMMRADFMAAIQILVYAGAIMILVVFVIMLLGVERDAEKVKFPVPAYTGLIFAAVFVGIMYTLISGYDASTLVYNAANGAGSADELTGDRTAAIYRIGSLLLNEHFVAFQATGVLLLGAIIGAALLSYTKERPMLPGRGLRATQEKYRSKSVSDSE